MSLFLEKQKKNRDKKYFEVGCLAKAINDDCEQEIGMASYLTRGMRNTEID